MVYCRCKCGSLACWDSGMAPFACSPCPRCGSVPAPGPNQHPDPVPHDFSYVEQVETDEGIKTLHRCCMCMRTQAEIEKV